MDLTEAERNRFVEWLDHEAEQAERLAKFLGTLPDGTNGATIRDHCTADAAACAYIRRKLMTFVYTSPAGGAE